MNIIFSKPPEHIYDACVNKFGVSFDDGIIFTYGDNVYTKYPMPNYKVIHEQEHTFQQKKIGKDIWWEKYLSDDMFRLEQEIEAYKAEMTYLKRLSKYYSREMIAKIRHQNAIDLSSSMYGNLISYSAAYRILI